MSNRKSPGKETRTNSLSHHSCALCRQRKVKCDKKDPCTYCFSRGVSCLPPLTSAPRPRKRRFPEAVLLARLKRYETVLKDYGVNIDSINTSEEAGNTALILQECRPVSPRSKQPTNQPSKCPEQDSVQSRDRLREVSDRVLESSSEDEVEQCPILPANCSSYGSGESVFPFSLGVPIDLPNLHPPHLQMFNLWQVFLDNVHPLLKLFHAATIQQKLLNLASNLPAASPTTHALFLSIYANAVQSITDDACMAIMHETRSSLVAQYTTGAQYALQKCGFLQSSDLTVLQAFLLYLYSTMKIVDPRSFLCLTAIADRIAKRDGLHCSTQGRGLSAFDTEIRRRVWWQTVLLDSRAVEMSGAGTPILSYAWDAKLPLNINESELSPDANPLPQEHDRATDMVFCLVRCEIANFLRQIRARKGLEDGWAEFSSPSISATEKFKAIDTFEQHLQARYLSHCDCRLPLHALTHYYAVQYISKMRLITYASLSRRGRSMNTVEAKERQEVVMQICVTAIRAYHRSVGDRSLMQYAWFLSANAPFLAHMYLFLNLRYRTKGDLTDQAWEVVGNHDDIFGRPECLREFGVKLREDEEGTMLAAFARLIIEAWEAREATLGGKSRALVPRLVKRMREILANTKRRAEKDATVINNDTNDMNADNSASAAMSGRPVNAPGVYSNAMTGCQGDISSSVDDIQLSSADPNSVMPMDRLGIGNDPSMWDYWQTLLSAGSLESIVDPLIANSSWEFTLSGEKRYPSDRSAYHPLLYNVNPTEAHDDDLIIRTKNGTWHDIVLQVGHSPIWPRDFPHPIHKHANKYWQIGSGNGVWNYTSAAEAMADHLEDFNLVNPPYRDTFVTDFTGAMWVVLRYQVTDPGAWMLHCHIEAHLDNGMAMAILDGVDKWPEVPPEYAQGMRGFRVEDVSTQAFLIQALEAARQLPPWLWAVALACPVIVGSLVTKSRWRRSGGNLGYEPVVAETLEVRQSIQTPVRRRSKASRGVSDGR